MSRQIYCKKLGKYAEGMKRAPCTGELGDYLYQHISEEAWQLWLKQQTIFINENRLKMIDPEARQFIRKQMQAFLIGDIDGSHPNTV